MSSACHLSRLGYRVTVFEALPEPGGMLMYGIPEYRLPKEVLRKEIGYIRDLGVEIRTGFRVGIDASLQEIRADHKAVFIAVGAHGGTRLGMEGEELPGVMEGIRFLRDINLGSKVETGKKVAVIGGGNTAVDCARAARRLGGEEVTIIYRRTRDLMPALDEDLAAAEREGITIHVLAAPKRLISEKGKLAGIECVRMELAAPDASGRPQPVPVAGSEFVVPVDTLVGAIGQIPESGFASGPGLIIDKRGMIEISPATAETNLEGVFAGGDSSGTKAFVADAIAAGKMGALAIHCFLEGKEIRKEFEKHRIGARPSFSFSHPCRPRGPRVRPQGYRSLREDQYPLLRPRCAKRQP